MLSEKICVMASVLTGRPSRQLEKGISMVRNQLERQRIGPRIDRQSYLAAAILPDGPSVRRLLSYVPPAAATTLCLDIVNLFLGEESLYALPVVDSANVPITLLDRLLFWSFSAARTSAKCMASKRSRTF